MQNIDYSTSALAGGSKVFRSKALAKLKSLAKANVEIKSIISC